MYRIIHENGNIFMGGRPTESRWNEIKGSIKKLEYSLGGKTFVMENYERYNHIVEIGVILKAGKKVTKIVLMGVSGNTVTAIELDLMKRIIRPYQAQIGREFNGAMTTGWKKGVSGKTAKYSIK